MPDNQLHLGLVGAGRIGRVHAEHLCRRIPEVRLAAVADVNESVAMACAQEFGIPEWSADARKVLDNPEVQAVLICSPTDTHSQWIEAAAAQGKHIFCEKPLDFDLGRIDLSLRAVKEAGVILQTGFNRRFDPNFARVRQAVADGEIGTPHQIHIISRDPAPPPLEYIAKSGGIFMDMTIHDFDMARFLAGAEVEEVYATGSARVEAAIGKAGDLDTAEVLLKFANGIVATIENCRQAAYGYDQRVEVFGSGGGILIDNDYPNTARVQGKSAIYRDLPLNFFMQRYIESYLVEMRAFLDAVRSRRPSPVSGHDGRMAVVIAHAARRSWAENRPVRLSEVG